MKPQAEPGVGDALDVRRAEEALKDAIALFLGDSDPPVDDGDARLVTGCADLEPRWLIAVLHRILDQVLEDLLHSRPIDQADKRLIWPRQWNGDSAFAMPGSNNLDDGAQVVRDAIHEDLPLLKSLSVKELGDEIAEASRLPHHARHPGGIDGRFGIASQSPLHQLGLAEDNGERRAQVVGRG